MKRKEILRLLYYWFDFQNSIQPQKHLGNWIKPTAQKSLSFGEGAKNLRAATLFDRVRLNPHPPTLAFSYEHPET